jgi:hypothetical protein
MEPMDKQVERTLDVLANFDFEIVYRPGRRHGNADALSRAPHVNLQAEAEAPVGLDAVHALAVDVGPIGGRRMARLQHQDEDLQPLFELVKTGEKPSALEVRSWSAEAKVYAGLFDNLSLDKNGQLLITTASLDGLLPGRTVPCLPRSLWAPSIMQAHETGAHMPTTEVCVLSAHAKDDRRHSVSLLSLSNQASP